MYLFHHKLIGNWLAMSINTRQNHLQHFTLH